MKIGELKTGNIEAGDARFAIVACRFNDMIVNNLLNAATETLLKHGVQADSIDTIHVPGAFELPVTALHLANTERYAAIIGLGCVIRGDTPHFDFVAGECARGMMEVGLRTGTPLVFGVLTTDTLAQAQLRAQPNGENKGVDAALCALEMSNTIAAIQATD